MRKKINSYLGFAKKSRSLLSGYNTCIFAIKQGKLKLLILSEDLSEGTVKKLTKLSIDYRVPFRIYGKTEELSKVTGSQERGVFGITDLKFADVILKEIDKDDKE